MRAGSAVEFVLSDADRTRLLPHLEAITKPYTTGRRAYVDVWLVIDAIVYRGVHRIGWRQLPGHYPSFNTVYDYFRRWRSTELRWQIQNLIIEKRRAL